MKRMQMTLAAAIVLATLPVAAADSTECSGSCDSRETAPPATTAIDLCKYGAVREVARIDHDLQPVKDVVGIVTNPTGFVIREVDQHVVHIPVWVGYALDPKGAIRAKAMDFVRREAKKSVGLQSECRSAPAPVEVPAEAA
jgi:hypothetical protein